MENQMSRTEYRVGEFDVRISGPMGVEIQESVKYESSGEAFREMVSPFFRRLPVRVIK
jgi:hypothetical protein